MSQMLRSVLSDRSRFLGWFWNGKTHLMTKKYGTHTIVDKSKSVHHSTHELILTGQVISLRFVVLALVPQVWACTAD